MTHEELDRLGPELQDRCNAEIARRFPSWSRYAVDQMLYSTMNELAPNWEYMVLEGIGSVAAIALTQYRGAVG